MSDVIMSEPPTQKQEVKKKKPNSFKCATIDEFYTQTEQLFNDDPKVK
jgi:hypothetical protein